MSLLEKNNGLDKVSSTTVRRQYTDVAKLVHALKKPIEVTVNGKADLVLMKPDLFEALMDLLEDYEDALALLNDASTQYTHLYPLLDRLKDVQPSEFDSQSIDELLNQ